MTYCQLHGTIELQCQIPPRPLLKHGDVKKLHEPMAIDATLAFDSELQLVDMSRHAGKLQSFKQLCRLYLAALTLACCLNSGSHSRVADNHDGTNLLFPLMRFPYT